MKTVACTYGTHVTGLAMKTVARTDRCIYENGPAGALLFLSGAAAGTRGLERKVHLIFVWFRFFHTI